jgi:hypothetical protein
MNSTRFRAKYVSTSENGDYYQVTFENTDPAGDAADVDGPDSPYFTDSASIRRPRRWAMLMNAFSPGVLPANAFLSARCISQASSVEEYFWRTV